MNLIPARRAASILEGTASAVQGGLIHVSGELVRVSARAPEVAARVPGAVARAPRAVARAPRAVVRLLEPLSVSPGGVHRAPRTVAWVLEHANPGRILEHANPGRILEHANPGRILEHANPGRHQRRRWAVRGRAHIEVRAVHRPGNEAAIAHLERALEAVKGVQWARVNAVAGRVVVVFDPEGPSVDDLVDVVEGVEEEHDLADERFPHDRPEHPGDVEPIRRNAIAMGADVVGLGVSVFGQLLQATPFPSEFASLVSLAEQQPRIRRFLEQHLGVPATDLGLGIASAFSQALGQGPVGLIVDIANRANVVGELQARRQTWERREPELAEIHDRVALEAIAHEPRATPMPSGPVERYADAAALASMSAMGASLAVTRSPRRAAAFFAAGVPKAARLGREAFAAHLGRELARRDVVVLDGNVLRRLDRVDTLLLDADVLVTEGVDHKPDPLAEPLARAARRDGLLLVVAGSRPGVAGHIGAPRTMPGGHRLKETVRVLQREGRVVLLVSGGEQQAAMAAADCAVGVSGRAVSTPWGADLVTRSGLGDAHLIVSSVQVARQVSVRSALISLVGSGVGGAWSMIGPAQSAGRRAALPVNVAALMAQVHGVVSAELFIRRPEPAVTSPNEWHAMDVSSVLASLSTKMNGLNDADAARRRQVRRKELPAAARFGQAVASELANPLTPVLAVGTGLAGAVGSVVDAVLVASVTGANAVVGGVQKMRTDASIARLLEASTTTVTVRRSGRVREVARDELVVGDIVELSAGDVVAADCRVISAESLEVDESILTGESLPVEKHSEAVAVATLPERRSMLYEGTTIVNGSAVAVVVATGDETEVGRSLADAPPPPPSGVEARLRSLTAVTVPATFASGALVSALSLLRGRSPRVAVQSGVSLMVAAVPEGLPILATAAQLAAAHRMSDRGALVRNPRTMEALGRVDLLCFDKTGTLTAGEIALQRVSDGVDDETVANLGHAERMTLAAALRASPSEALPHATDRAVVEGAESASVSPDEGVGRWELIDELAFAPARGYHAVVGRTPEGPRISVKGAPEIVLPRCARWRGPEGTMSIDADVRGRLDGEVERLAGRGLRVLAVAEAAVAEAESPGGHELSDDDVVDLELLGFLGMADRVRTTASEAVRTLRAAGVDVVMITGDHPATASAVAEELGLGNGNGVMTGAELDALEDEALDKQLESVSVFARVTPSHKVRIVRAYQRIGRVVAMTGDGANDAPAIRRAHTGIALGVSCSPAAREAADLVVVDDRIETIVDAIIEGRAMWTSVREALAILVGGNLGEVAFTLAGTAISGASPLGARQLLLVNLLTDMLPALAIALRQPRTRNADALLHEGPDASLGSALARQIALRAAVTAGGATGAWLLARPTGTGRRASTVGLAALVGTQLGQTAVIGGRSPVVLVSTLVSAGVLFGVVQTPGVSQFFGCTPLGPVAWSIATGATVAATGASVIVPWTARRFGRRGT